MPRTMRADALMEGLLRTFSMNPSFRMLLIAVSDDSAAAFEEVAPEGVEVHRAARPGEAIRRFDALSPDGVVLGVGKRPEQTALMVQALRDRPLGALIPVVLLDQGESPAHPLATPSGAAEAGADRFFVPGTPAAVILSAVSEMLGVVLDLPVGPDPTPQPPSPSAVPKAQIIKVEHSEAVVHHASEPVPRPIEQARAPVGSFERRMRQPEAVTPEIIRRKVRQARHEDYFALLDIRKGADERRIEESYRRLRSRFEPTRLPQTLADRHYHELNELCDAFDDAFAVLADNTLRTAYLRGLLESVR